MTTPVDPVVDVLEEGKHPLDSLFRPKRVAVAGATDKHGSVGRTLLKNLISNPFGGVVYLRGRGLPGEPQAPTRPGHFGLPIHRGLPGAGGLGHRGDARVHGAVGDPGLCGSEGGGG